MRLALAAAAAVGTIALVSAASATRSARFDLPDFAYSVTVRHHLGDTAVCVARNGDPANSRRLAGLVSYSGMDWSPDGSRFAIAFTRRFTGPILTARAQPPVRFRALTSPRRATEDDSAPRWSPDGRVVAFSRYVSYGPPQDYNRAGLWVVGVRSRRERQFSRRYSSDIAWSPSGALLAVRLVDELAMFTAGGRHEWTFSRGEDRGGAMAWSPSGDVIAAQFEREILLITPGREVLATIVLPDTPLVGLEQGLSWSPDGNRLAVGGGAIYSRSGQLVGRYAPPSTREAAPYAPRWTPDGTAIIFERAATGYFGSRYQQQLTTLSADLYVAPSSGGEATQLTSTPSINEAGVVFRPGRAGGTAGTAVPCILLGSPASNVIFGSAGEDLINAGPGNDVVYGRGGNDLIFGGDGNDALFAGPGKDTVYGDRGDDRLYARDKARDKISGGPGRDQAWTDRRLDFTVGIERRYRR